MEASIWSFCKSQQKGIERRINVILCVGNGETKHMLSLKHQTKLLNFTPYVEYTLFIFIARWQEYQDLGCNPYENTIKFSETNIKNGQRLFRIEEFN